MVAVKLDGTRVERICNLRVNKKLLPSDDQYYFEAHGCPSPDGLRVIFASDWDLASYPVQAYVADFRDKVIQTSVGDKGIPMTGSGSMQLSTYPNPFSEATSIFFSVPIEGHAVLKVYNLMGMEVATLFENFMRPGKPYTLPFDAGSLPSGIYSVVLKCGHQSVTSKLILNH